MPACIWRGWQAIIATGRGDKLENGQGPMYLKIDYQSWSEEGLGLGTKDVRDKAKGPEDKEAIENSASNQNDGYDG